MAIPLEEYQTEKRRIEMLFETATEVFVDAGRMGSGAMTAWVPARPLPGPGEWKRRFRAAWEVLCGRATIIRWY